MRPCHLSGHFVSGRASGLGEILGSIVYGSGHTANREGIRTGVKSRANLPDAGIYELRREIFTEGLVKHGENTLPLCGRSKALCAMVCRVLPGSKTLVALLARAKRSLTLHGR